MSLEYIDIDGTHSKIDDSIQILRMFEKQALDFDPEGYYVCDSGGKDSTVIKQLCIDAGVKFAVYHNHTTVDHPETVYFVRREKKRFEDMGYKYTISHTLDRDGKRVTMWSLIAKNSFPTQIRRFCCKFLKEAGGDRRVCVTGVRRAESVKRSKRGVAEVLGKTRKDAIILTNDNDDKRQFLEHCVMRHKVTVNPIIDWEDEDVWEYIRSKNIPYNPLYDRGYKRIGCVGCPMNNRRKQELDENPKYKQAYKHAFEKYLDSHPHLKDEYGWTVDEWYDWWLGDKQVKNKNQVTIFDEDNDEYEL